MHVNVHSLVCLCWLLAIFGYYLRSVFFSSPFFELITSLILSLPVLGGGIMVWDSINTAWIRWDLDLFIWFPSYDRCQARICMQRIGRSRLKGPINAEAVGSPVEDEWKLQINRLLRESSISPSEEHCWCEAVQYIQLDVKWFQV